MGFVLIAFVACGLLFIHYYNRYAAIIDARLKGQMFTHPSLVFAAPEEIRPGEAIAPADIVAHLRRAGYSDEHASPVGTFALVADSLNIRPGPESYYDPVPASVRFRGGQIDSIANLTTGGQLSSYDLEPELLTTLGDEQREKRRLLKYSDLPPLLVDAVISIEDRNFFHEGAVNYWRIPTAAWRDLRAGYKEQGFSTITMQVARNFFLTSKKTFRRKLTEMMIAEELEQRLTKQQIFELYANEAYMGQHGTYSIRGFGEAANVYFDKDVKQLTLPECAMLAGIIHSPNLDSPYRHPDRMTKRRNQVLTAMAKEGYISDLQREESSAAPLGVTLASAEAGEAPYFVDLVRDQISDQIAPQELLSQGDHIYTTIDPDLQAAAASAVGEGLKEIDALIAKQRRRRTRVGHAYRVEQTPGPQAQVALIALDPHTGEVKALIGGRNYATSQLNHVLAQRPTGSIFKPFVYASALETAINGSNPVLTQVSTVMDEPTTFEGGYQPANFENKYFGKVTLRVALEHSLNNATISLAEEVGLGSVADLARQAGITSVQPTPSMAIGTYTASPMQMAEAYTIFANGGVEVRPRLLYDVQTQNGSVIYKEPLKQRTVLDPRIAFLVTNLMQSVINQGTAMRVRAMGFTAPAAGKTGTSHDGWFAGYTNNLLCVVWVGFDDYSNLNLEGAHSALPIWTDFMKQAVSLPAYNNVGDFTPPAGVVAVTINLDTGQVVTPACPATHTEVDYFIDGTQPASTCGSPAPVSQ